MASVSKTITDQNQFTDPISIVDAFNLSISGTFDATVTVQRSFSGGVWHDVDTFTTPTEQYGYDPEGVLYRAGVKTGEFTSGPAVVRIGQ